MLSTSVARKLLTLHFPSLTSAALNYIHGDQAPRGLTPQREIDSTSASLLRWERKPGTKVADTTGRGGPGKPELMFPS